VLLAIVAAVVALRVAVGETRALDLERSDQRVAWSHVPARVVEAVWTGPQVSIAAFVTRPGWAMAMNLDAGLGLGVAASFAVMFTALALGPGFAAGMAPRPVLLRAGITGLVMLVGGYALEFSGWHFPPVHKAGRLSAVHLGATLGAAILVASLLSIPWTLARGRATRVAHMAMAALTAFYLATLFGYRLVVQRGFVDAAEQQREYWSRIVSLVPDLSADSVVILIGSEPPRNRFIGPSSWSDTWVLRYLFHDASGRSPELVGGRFPLGRGAPPSGFDESLVQARGGRLGWSASAPPWLSIDRGAPLESGRLVVLERRRGEWERRAGSITLQGIDVDLPPASPGATTRLLPGPLHDLLLAPAGGTRASRR
jgi:hypothetical protein